jgi:nitrous oxidase accessory protein
MRYWLLVVCVGLGLRAESRSLYVKSGSKFPTVHSALLAARDGDTVRIARGIYRENNLLISKRLVLLGEQGAILDGQGKYEILTVTKVRAVIRSLTFRRSGRSNMDDYAGIKVHDAHGVQIIGNIFEDTFFGIHISNTDSAIIRNNRLKATAAKEYELGNGIHLWKCKQAQITDNHITGHRDGIYFEFVTNTLIARNESHLNKRYGLHFMFSDNNEYRKNTFRNNGAGVAVMYTAGIRMLENTFEENWGSASYGLLLKDIRDSEVRGNRFINNTSGIYMEGTSRTVFRENEFKGNGWAIQLQASCDANTFSSNNFMSNTFDMATNGHLVLNDINGNYWDKYEGYDLNKDGVGDIPYYPVSLFASLSERVPAAMLLWRSFLVFMLERAEKVMPAIIPVDLKDHKPSLKPNDLYSRAR